VICWPQLGQLPTLWAARCAAADTTVLVPSQDAGRHLDRLQPVAAAPGGRSLSAHRRNRSFPAADSFPALILWDAYIRPSCASVSSESGEWCALMCASSCVDANIYSRPGRRPAADRHRAKWLFLNPGEAVPGGLRSSGGGRAGMRAGLLVVTGVTKPARLTSPGASLPCRAGVRMCPPGLRPATPLPFRYQRCRVVAARAAVAGSGLAVGAGRPPRGALPPRRRGRDPVCGA
jgi:hypothetical protein